MLELSNLSRRQFIKKTVGGSAAIAGTALLPVTLTNCGSEQEKIRRAAIEAGQNLPRPSPAQLAWQNAEIGIIYHFDLPVAAGDYAPNNTSRNRFEPDQYNPTRLDTDQWLKAAKAAGAKFAVFTATHFNGFLQWQSDIYPYGLKQSKWRNGKGDVVADFVESCHKAGIEPGIYFSTHRNVYWEVWGHYVNWGEGKDTEQQEKFNRIAEQMTEELCSRYGKLFQIWYDAGVKTPEEGGPDVLPVFEKYQPDSVFYHNRQRADYRWIGNEDGYANYPCWATMPMEEGIVSHNSPHWRPILESGDPEGTVWSPGMVDIPLRGANGIHNWFWSPDQEQGIYTPEQLVDMYYTSVGRNSTFVIGAVVNPEGLVPEKDIDQLAQFGRKIQNRFGNPLAETSGIGNEIILELNEPQVVREVVIQEEIEHGERIRDYRLEGLGAGNRWETLAAGAAVGHKRIEKLEGKKLTMIRLKIDQSKATPMIKQLAVY